jgi:mannuronan synthase
LNPSYLKISLCVLPLLVLVVSWPEDALKEYELLKTLSMLGVLAAWRYGWGAVLYWSAVHYLYHLYPSAKKKLSSKTIHWPEVGVVVTSWQLSSIIFTACYERLREAAAAYPARVRIIAMVTNAHEINYLNQMSWPDNVLLQAYIQDGQGKRAALAYGLSTLGQSQQQGVVALMDGDVYLRRDSLIRSVPWLVNETDLGAVTTHNALVRVKHEDLWITAWHRLRFAQRHILMSAQSVHRRLLVLTGRFSLFRGDIALNSEFIQQIQFDTIDHGCWGTVSLVTGDDKSTWFYILKQGVAMRYLPDIVVDCAEQMETRHFLDYTIPRMRRWLGNMMLNNGRALRLGVVRMPLFTWMSLLDQRLNLWTTLGVPVAVLIMAFTHNAHILWGYAAWVLFSRSLQAVLLGVITRTWPMLSWPYLLYYGQVVGSFIKLHAWLNPMGQRWRGNRVAFSRVWYLELSLLVLFSGLVGWLIL